MMQVGHKINRNEWERRRLLLEKAEISTQVGMFVYDRISPWFSHADQVIENFSLEPMTEDV